MNGCPWTRAELSSLEEYLYEGLSDREIGARMHRSENAVQIARKRHAIPSRYDFMLTSRSVQRRLGLRCSKTVSYWIQKGWLKGRRAAHRGAHRMWLVEEDDLLAFLEDERFWHLWNPNRMANPVEREWAISIRGDVYLTTGEVGRRLAVQYSTVLDWIRKGFLPAVRWGNWRVREADLAGFVLPCDRPHAGSRPVRFSEAEDAQLLRLRVEGCTGWTEIAHQMGRSTSSVFGRYQRLASCQGVAP